MSRPQARKLAPLAIAVAALAAGVAGCNSGHTYDYANGRALFVAKCGTCHTLAEAATTAQVGPNLDAAFAADRSVGMDDDTVQGVVHAQIENPRPSDPESVNTYMPAELVTGDDATDVAYYVGKVAGVPGIGPPEAPGGPGGQVFANNGCGACHTLEGFPGAAGSVGPNLSQELPGQSAKEIEQSIVDPGAQIVPGFPDGVMPTTYGDQIPPDELKSLVDFLIEFTSGGGSASAGADTDSAGSGN